MAGEPEEGRVLPRSLPGPLCTPGTGRALSAPPRWKFLRLGGGCGEACRARSAPVCAECELGGGGAGEFPRCGHASGHVDAHGQLQEMVRPQPISAEAAGLREEAWPSCWALTQRSQGATATQVYSRPCGDT